MSSRAAPARRRASWSRMASANGRRAVQANYGAHLLQSMACLSVGRSGRMSCPRIARAGAPLRQRRRKLRSSSFWRPTRRSFRSNASDWPAGPRPGSPGSAGSAETEAAILHRVLNWQSRRPERQDQQRAHARARRDDEPLPGRGRGDQEAILNAMCMAETMSGRDGRTVHALPLDLLQEVMQRYRPRKGT